jgi:hypothetical protein
MQVRAMTRFTESGERTARPEQLSSLETAAIFAGVPHMPIVQALPSDWRRDVSEFLARVL